MRLCLMILTFAAACAVPARAEEITWPLVPCTAEEIASASPAPLPADSASLALVPFSIGFHPMSAGYIVALDDDGLPSIKCATPDSDYDFVHAGAVAVAGLDFAMPRRPSTAGSGGRYLVRLTANFGIGTVRPPPKLPLLPECPPITRGFPSLEKTPGVHRVKPAYPDGALEEGIEGQVTVVMDVFASGAVSPRCLGDAAPVGWFEQSAVEAISQWRFDPDAGPRLHYYTVTVRFRVER